MDQSWKLVLRTEFEKPYFKQLSEFVTKERDEATVYPPAGEVFSAFETAYKEVSVVILGQDPYHGAGQAHGLSFSVRPGVKPPPSLVNIYKELATDLGCTNPGHGYLGAWAKQGVFLLNTTLTVREGKAGSHQGQGWEVFTDAVIRLLNDRPLPMAFVLWGRHAHGKADLIDPSRHFIVQTPHPSPFSAASGFFGSKCFSRVNEGLVKRGVAPINWQLPKDPNALVGRPVAPPPPLDLDTVLQDQFPGYER